MEPFRADLDPAEDLEELPQLLDELDQEDAPEDRVSDDQRILELIEHAKHGRNGLGTILRNISHYAFPTILLSERLNIAWTNREYEETFKDEEKALPRNLAADFPNELHSEGLNKIYKAINDPDSSYSYRGKLKAILKHRHNREFNVIITPIFIETPDRPSLYQALFDDITEEQRAILQNTFLSLLEASKLKDNDTGKHIQRVGEYSKIIAEHLYRQNLEPDINPEFIDSIQFLAQMHDVGKIGTPDDILNKEDALNETEWEIMREHTINGAYIMSTYPHPMAREIALFHHERWDGNGYPYRISETMIPLSARIVAVADVYDALRMERSYKESIEHGEAVSIILADRGSHFDPTVVDAFLEQQRLIESVYGELLD